MMELIYIVEYDQNGNQTSYRAKSGYGWRCKYDSHGTPIYKKWFNGDEAIYEYTFHPNGNLKTEKYFEKN